MPRDTAQMIAELEARLTRLKERDRKKATHEKVLIGSVMMVAALKDRQTGLLLRHVLTTGVTRDKERAALADFIARLPHE